MLDGQVQEDAVIRRIAGQADGRGDTGDNLRAIGKVERLAQARGNDGGKLALQTAAGCRGFIPFADPLEHEVQIARCCVDDTGAEVEMPQVAVFRRSRPRQKGRAGVEMNKGLFPQRGAEREIDLIAQRVFAEAAVGIAGGQDETEARREGAQRVLVEEHLVAVIEHHVAEAVFVQSAAADKGVRQGVTELMFLAEDRPFLREAKLPNPEIRSGQLFHAVEAGEDVLHDAGFLIVRFLDQKRIVENAIHVAFGCGGLGGTVAGKQRHHRQTGAHETRSNPTTGDHGREDSSWFV